MSATHKGTIKRHRQEAALGWSKGRYKQLVRALQKAIRVTAPEQMKFDVEAGVMVANVTFSIDRKPLQRIGIVRKESLDRIAEALGK